MTNKDTKSKEKKFLPQSKYQWFLLLGTIGLTEVLFSWIGISLAAILKTIAPEMAAAGKFDTLIGLSHTIFGVFMMIIFYLLAISEKRNKNKEDN